MNRPDMYIAQLTAQAAWLRAQGDDEGAALAEELADRFNTRHEGVLDVTTPDWTVIPGPDALDIEPAIRCWPEVGCVFEGEDGPILTIDPMDGGDVAIVHMGDVVKWMEARLGADADAQAKIDAERIAHDATVGNAYEAGEPIDAEFEEEPEPSAAELREDLVASLARRLQYMAPEVREGIDPDILAEAQARWEKDHPETIAKRVAAHTDPELQRLQAAHPDLPPAIVEACADDIRELDGSDEADLAAQQQLEGTGIWADDEDEAGAPDHHDRAAAADLEDP